MPGTPWRAISWQKGAKELWGIGVLEGAYPCRADILRLDISTRKISVTPLEFPEGSRSWNWDYVDFKFSPDGKVVVAGFPHSLQMFWDASTGQFLKEFLDESKGSFNPNSEPQFSLDGQKVLHLTPKGVEIYRLDQILPR